MSAAEYAAAFKLLRMKNKTSTMATINNSSIVGMKKRALRSGIPSVGSGAVYIEFLYPGIFNIYVEINVMVSPWRPCRTGDLGFL